MTFMKILMLRMTKNVILVVFSVHCGEKIWIIVNFHWEDSSDIWVLVTSTFKIHICIIAVRVLTHFKLFLKLRQTNLWTESIVMVVTIIITLLIIVVIVVVLVVRIAVVKEHVRTLHFNHALCHNATMQHLRTLHLNHASKLSSTLCTIPLCSMYATMHYTTMHYATMHLTHAAMPDHALCHYATMQHVCHYASQPCSSAQPCT